jgi:hypothetical protein
MTEQPEVVLGCGKPCPVEQEGTKAEHINCMNARGKCGRYRRVQLREDLRNVASDLAVVLSLFVLGWSVVYKLAMTGFA